MQDMLAPDAQLMTAVKLLAGRPVRCPGAVRPFDWLDSDDRYDTNIDVAAPVTIRILCFASRCESQG